MPPRDPLLPWKGQTLLPEERKLVPVASLKLDLIILDVEEAAATQAKRISPL